MEESPRPSSLSNQRSRRLTGVTYTIHLRVSGRVAALASTVPDCCAFLRLCSEGILAASRLLGSKARQGRCQRGLPRSHGLGSARVLVTRVIRPRTTYGIRFRERATQGNAGETMRVIEIVIHVDLGTASRNMETRCGLAAVRRAFHRRRMLGASPPLASSIKARCVEIRSCASTRR